MSEKLKTSGVKKQIPVSLLVLLIGVIITAILMMIPPNREEIPENQLPWNSAFDEHGSLHALGLTLNQSTPNDARILFGADLEIKLFSKKDESEKTAEVYFPSISIGTIRGAIALNLKVDDNQLNTMYTRGVQTTVTQVGNRQVTPNSDDTFALLTKPIALITLVPRKNLTERTLEMRFGKPDRKEKQSDGLNHWFYKSKGLEILLDPKGPDALQYHPIEG